MKKRMFLLFGTLVLLSVTLVACSEKKNNSNSEEMQLGPEIKGATADPNETKELKKLYQDAIKEFVDNDEKLVVWAGGDAPDQQKELENAFKTRFPEVPIEIKVDLSKFHDIKINEQLKNNNLQPDVAMLQTTHDFDLWKKQDQLYAYKPVGFEKQRKNYADKDGYYITGMINSFLPEVSKEVGEVESYEDFLKPDFKDKLILTYPHDDDAVLYVYDKIIEKYGDEYLEKLKEQNPTFLRGTAAPAAIVAKGSYEGRKYTGNLTGYAQSPKSDALSFVPKTDPFITWTQRAAMFDKTRHKAAAKLFLSFISSKEYQSSGQIWPTRTDLKSMSPYKELEKYPNTDFNDFAKWMSDREHIENLKQKMITYFGEVEGESPLTDKGLLETVK
ncbi:ABC transporter substrate-binding protein [Listeria aquatica]|uniref:ABC transporter substrate-binding protein n=1 Tax=Listeria aquatica TaxID=1494960 RepID=UPI003F716808